jgi:hypothetical protein
MYGWRTFKVSPGGMAVKKRGMIPTVNFLTRAPVPQIRGERLCGQLQILRMAGFQKVESFHLLFLKAQLQGER